MSIAKSQYTVQLCQEIHEKTRELNALTAKLAEFGISSEFMLDKRVAAGNIPYQRIMATIN
jgi:hypothetical protein